MTQEYLPANYKAVRKDSVGKKGGGVLSPLGKISSVLLSPNLTQNAAASGLYYSLLGAQQSTSAHTTGQMFPMRKS